MKTQLDQTESIFMDIDPEREYVVDDEFLDDFYGFLLENKEMIKDYEEGSDKMEQETLKGLA